MKDSGVGYSKLLVARGNERSRVICSLCQQMKNRTEEVAGKLKLKKA